MIHWVNILLMGKSNCLPSFVITSCPMLSVENATLFLSVLHDGNDLNGVAVVKENDSSQRQDIRLNKPKSSYLSLPC